MSDIGHNSGERAAPDELRVFIERIERLKDEKAVQAQEYADAIKEVYAEAKGRGYDKKAMDHAMKLRALDTEARAVVEFYCDVLDVFQ